MITLLTGSEEETRRLARRLAQRLRGGEVVALAGPLGAGKTCFVRGLAEGLSIDPRQVSSPTFIIHQEYEPPVGGAARLRLAHLDGYRISSPEDLASIGLDELLAEKDTVVAVEWPERFGAALPEHRVDVRLEHVEAHGRRITLSAPPSLADRLEAMGEEQGGAEGRCPICGTRVPRDAVRWPFCSARCRLVDLGRWLGGRYCVSQPADEQKGF